MAIFLLNKNDNASYVENCAKRQLELLKMIASTCLLFKMGIVYYMQAIASKCCHVGHVHVDQG